ncbi:tripartite tricarboxylate transporter substrate binding protein [Sporosarcina sp. GW1-11]|uniref:Bug family tripartite tricarboxylate transporter substrate binding protein n=1 Tax=Sporosarcina sp. GW1-11 TaxID=2899126 RepID=UPI00294CA3DE|nr:tripartite tricarboxylate transporter substrate binding protein [Sporosarcina sp. GW1-11]MDV6377443.1 tripartite tricarboxylate transporter substrate binding protein [Sporosarcina sp. GW1-11]
MKKNIIFILAALMLIIAGCSSGKSTDDAKESSGGSTSEYPKKPLELVVPFSPGGSTDVFARAVAKELPAYLPNKQQVAVINKPGAGTTLGLTDVAKSKPDGYTIGFTTSSGLDIQPAYGKTAYKPEDFAPIIKTYELNSAIVVKKDSPLNTYEDWLAYVKENPGKFTYGTSGGTGSGGHIAMEDLSKELGVETKHVPFEGVADVMNAVMSGQIEGGQMRPDTDVGGDLKPLLFTTDSKGVTDFYKDTPNTTELGLHARSEYYAGFIAPKGTPEEIVTILHDAIKEVMDLPQIKELMEKQNLVVSYGNPEEFATTIKDAVERNTAIMEDLGLIK